MSEGHDKKALAVLQSQQEGRVSTVPVGSTDVWCLQGCGVTVSSPCAAAGVWRVTAAPAPSLAVGKGLAESCSTHT